MRGNRVKNKVHYNIKICQRIQVLFTKKNVLMNRRKNNWPVETLENIESISISQISQFQNKPNTRKYQS